MSFIRRDLIRYKALPLSPSERKSLQGVGLSLMGEVRRANRRTGRMAFVAGLAFLAAGGAAWDGVARFAQLAQVRPPEVHWIGVDQINGDISPIAGVDAAKELLRDPNQVHWIMRYVELNYTYTWEMDRSQEEAVRLLSSRDQFARYQTWMDGDPLSPKQKLARKGHSEVDKITVSPLPPGDAQTLHYAVHFLYREITGGNVGSWITMSGDIQYQWHPELVKSALWVRHNALGFYCIYFQAEPEKP